MDDVGIWINIIFLYNSKKMIRISNREIDYSKMRGIGTAKIIKKVIYTHKIDDMINMF